MIRFFVAMLGVFISTAAFADIDSAQAKKIYEMLPGFEGYGKVVDVKCGPKQSYNFNPADFSGSASIEYNCAVLQTSILFQGYLAQVVYGELKATKNSERQGTLLCGTPYDAPTQYVCGVVVFLD
jgi:hypothetical protein